MRGTASPSRVSPADRREGDGVPLPASPLEARAEPAPGAEPFGREVDPRGGAFGSGEALRSGTGDASTRGVARAEQELPELWAGPQSAQFGIYVHCVFCRTRCPYCDFNVAIYREDRVAPFLAALGAEVDGYGTLPWAGRVPAISLFFGGGTPSLLPPAAIGDLIGAVHDRLGLSAQAEVTLEANPEGLDLPRLRGFREAGVTRLSLGVQSLDDEMLARLGREHTAGAARTAFDAAREAGFGQMSVDLLYGCPGQSLEVWMRTLEEALAWGPEHLSAYALTLEPGTRFGKRPPAGLPDEPLQLAQWTTLLERTAAAGLERYEVSNFARPGFESRHNLLYWRRQDYLGLGPGAHGALGAVRLQNLRAHPRYQTTLAAGRWPIETWERLDPDRIAGERLVLGLRLAEGVPATWLAERFAREPGRLARWLERGRAARVLDERAGRVVLTERGVLVSDTLFADLV